MSSSTRILATVVATLTFGGVATLPANADPTPSPPPSSLTARPDSQGPSTYHVVRKGTAKAKKAQYDFSNQVAKATSPAHTNSSGQIDYRWVKKSFGPHASSRDGFALGWWSRRHDWKQFTHISSNDKKKIIKWGKTHKVPGPKSTSNSHTTTSYNRTASPARPMAPNPCTGTSKIVVDGNKASPSAIFWVWYNSCDTDTAIAKSHWCAPVVGAIGAIGGALTGGLAAVPGAVAVVACLGNAEWLSKAQKESSLSATIVRQTAIHYDKKSKRYLVPWWVYSQ